MAKHGARLLACAVLLITPQSAAAGSASSTGSTAMPDQVLRRGCHEYSYTYQLAPDSPDWTLETYLIDPRGTPLASGAFIGGYDATSGRGEFTICRNTTRRGIFKLKAKLTVYLGPHHDVHVSWLPKTRIRLHRWGG